MIIYVTFVGSPIKSEQVFITLQDTSSY